MLNFSINTYINVKTVSVITEAVSIVNDLGSNALLILQAIQPVVNGLPR
jgi:hypothetical protein